MPRQVCQALARWNWSARTNTETRHQADQPQLDHVEAHEPGGGVHQGLDVVVRVRVEDGESGEHERGCEEEHAPRSGRELPDRARPCVRAGLCVAHFLFLSSELSVCRSASSKKSTTRRSYSRGAASMPPVWSDPGDLPDRLRFTCGREVLRLSGALAADSGVGVDEQDRTWSDGADVVDDRWRRHVVGEDGRRGRHHGLRGVDQEPGEPGDVGFAHAFAGTFGDDGPDGLRLCGRPQQHLAADGEPHGAHPVGVHVGTLPQVGDARQDILIAGPSHGVALAAALSAGIEQQHPVSVREEHARLC